MSKITFNTAFLALFFLLNFSSVSVFAQINPLSATKALQKIEHLQTTGSVLYIAAHPDDENTRLITHFAQEKGYRTAYLSLTRGDGGQNLIGEQVREGLGIIRTNELLAARNTDGGTQFFSRANDFGYSKTPEETFTIWDKEQVLADAVWAIRKFRPDIIVTRFSPTLGGTHGHHTASAQIAMEAYDAAADPKQFPEQLKYVKIWQAKRIFWNTSSWFFKRNGLEMSKDSTMAIEIGDYDALLGKSYNEIAAQSRSQHKSQGFGSAGSRGEQTEYLQILKGDLSKENAFEGVVTDWTRIKGSEKFITLIQKLKKEYNPSMPQNSYETIAMAYREVRELEDSPITQKAIEDLKQLLYTASGLFIEAIIDQPNVVNGDSAIIELNIIKRINTPLYFNMYIINAGKESMQLLTDSIPPLEVNKMVTFKKKIAIQTSNYSNPYWLNENQTTGMYSVEDQELIGNPLSESELTTFFHIDLGIKTKTNFGVILPIQHKYTDPVKGEKYAPLLVVPKVTARFLDDVVIFADEKSKKVKLELLSNTDNPVSGKINIISENKNKEVHFMPSPSSIDFSFSKKGESKIIEIEINPPKNNQNDAFLVELNYNNNEAKTEFAKSMEKIDYDHIPYQAMFPNAKVRLMRAKLEKKGERIGYILGAGDYVPKALEQIGYQVDIIEARNLGTTDLSVYDAVLTGIRAFNIQDELAIYLPKLHKYVENGGNLIVQYNTAHRLVTQDMGVYPFHISRKRVTEENAKVTFELPNHPVLNTPNKITPLDFEGWTQERGLYFADSWDEHFEAPISSFDTGEESQKGSIIIAKYGKGNFAYTGISWFRQLPEGVTGAYRLLVNLISLEENK
ncbi:putative LmbE-like protein [Bernardetia litoralis DSM 6794]|uniref:Putative LmbE-like protein n=1 Tax=Bernardetia litoralis (strain ATCC 23117 / DSM 6794 / NBRC 15988 / NCIMB 1366 / Fx l1 / Sio-4) TaxID=880071 RepID=I4AQS1_BERLS|nr:PIG-L family deacetylase [Bernardetia litoralis]AFM06306.1 putative LmbE-like protein [Bernardetia litoralis DSM 6794]